MELSFFKFLFLQGATLWQVTPKHNSRFLIWIKILGTLTSPSEVNKDIYIIHTIRCYKVRTYLLFLDQQPSSSQTSSTPVFYWSPFNTVMSSISFCLFVVFSADSTNIWLTQRLIIQHQADGQCFIRWGGVQHFWGFPREGWSLFCPITTVCVPGGASWTSWSQPTFQSKADLEGFVRHFKSGGAEITKILIWSSHLLERSIKSIKSQNVIEGVRRRH